MLSDSDTLIYSHAFVIINTFVEVYVIIFYYLLYENDI